MSTSPLPESDVVAPTPPGPTAAQMREAFPVQMFKVQSDAMAAHKAMRSSHAKRSFKYRQIAGMFNGEPPYDPTKLAKANFPHANVNWKDSAAIHESVATTYWGLFNDVGTVAQFTLQDIGDPSDAAEHARIMGEEFDKVLREWQSFLPLMAQHQSQLIKYGASFLVWPDERNWKFDIQDVFHVLFPEGTRNRLDAYSLFAFEHVYTFHELWTIHETYTGSEWDKPALAAFLYASVKKGVVTGVPDDNRVFSGENWGLVAQSIRNGDLGLDQLFNQDVTLVMMLVKEFSGKVSRLIFPTNSTAGGNYLYEGREQYEDFSQAMCSFTWNPGEETLHGSKGLGHEIFNLIEAITKLDCGLYDSAKMSGTVLVSTSGRTGIDAKRLKFNPGGIVDIGEAKFEQNLMGSNVSGLVGVSQYFQGKMERNVGMYAVGAGSDVNGNAMSATEAGIRARRTASVQKSLIAHYQNCLDHLFREIVAKMLTCKDGHPGYEEVELWKERCMKRGVPEAVFASTKENMGQNRLPRHLSVRATRAAGSGSQMADQLETRELMELLPVLGERGRRQAIQDRVAAIRGYHFVDRYLPPEDEAKLPGFQDQLAVLENNSMEDGEVCLVSPEDNHAVHAQRHRDRMKQIAEAFRAGNYDLLDADTAFEQLGPHFTRHLLYMERDSSRRSLVEGLKHEWAILANLADEVKHNANERRQAQMRQEQEAAMQAQRADNPNSPEMVKIRADSELKMTKLQADIDRNAKRDLSKFLLDRQRITYQAELDRQKAQSKMALEALQAYREAEQKGAGGEASAGSLY